MSITSPSQPYAVTVQQTPRQYHADGNTGFPEKYVLEYFDDYDEAIVCFNRTIENIDELISEHIEGILDVCSYSPTAGDLSCTCVWFYADGTIEDHGIGTATEYGSF